MKLNIKQIQCKICNEMYRIITQKTTVKTSNQYQIHRIIQINNNFDDEAK